MKYLQILSIITATAFYCCSCGKSGFINEKPDQSITIPETLSDLQAILDYDGEMNATTSGSSSSVPIFGDAGSDDLYVPDNVYNSNYLELFKKIYTWQKEVYAGEDIMDWNVPYKVIYNSNTALDGLKKIDFNASDKTAFNNVKGSALFFRAHSFYQLAQLFAPVYRKETAGAAWGIPLRMNADLYEKIERATVQQTYDRIIADLKEAADLLPQMPLVKTRPSRLACYGLLSRVYLSMNDYDNAFAYADSVLQKYNALIDFNDYSRTVNFPFKQFVAEVIFACNASTAYSGASPVNPFVASVDSNLYKSYDEDDLRKHLYFKAFSGVTRLLGTYTGFQNSAFVGIAVDEIYLTRAECFARMDNITAAMDDLNTLMRKRWDKNVAYPSFTAASKEEAVEKILTERRKELIMRGIRWTDLRRLNASGANITLHRTVAGVDYSLPPNDPKYTYPIPPAVIQFNPGMPQNNR